MAGRAGVFGDAEQFEVLLRSHVERCLQEIWDETDLVTDGDGDFPFRAGSAMCWVSPRGGREPAVSVFAVAASDLRPSAGLLREVNALNASARWVSISCDDGAVQVRTELHWTCVDVPSLCRALSAVTEAANHAGPLLATVFGGRTPFRSDEAERDADEAEAA